MFTKAADNFENTIMPMIHKKHSEIYTEMRAS